MSHCVLHVAKGLSDTGLLYSVYMVEVQSHSFLSVAVCHPLVEQRTHALPAPSNHHLRPSKHATGRSSTSSENFFHPTLFSSVSDSELPLTFSQSGRDGRNEHFHACGGSLLSIPRFPFAHISPSPISPFLSNQTVFICQSCNFPG